VAEKSLYIATAMCDPENENVIGFDAVHDYVFTHGEAAAAETEIFIAGTPHVGDSVMELIRRFAISMLPLSFAT
jgi:hypothetical protein